jgi:hypothetical protein
VDFDFFTEAQLDRDAIREALPFVGRATVVQDQLGPGFQPSESLKALVFFGDGDLATLSGSEKATLVNAVRGVRELPTVTIVSRKLGTS